MADMHIYSVSTGRRLILTIILNFIITVVEIIGGILSGSLALISDALHNFSDGISVILSYFALKLKEKDNSYKHTFGYKRAEILVASINSSVLLAISVYLVYEAIGRFNNQAVIDSKLMLIVASIGLIANIAGTLLLKKDSENSLNIKSSYLHLLSDVVSSAAVILGAIAISLWKINWIDATLTILIAIYITRESYKILTEALHVLMEGAPHHIDLNEIKIKVEELDDVDDIHHLHIWTVGENDVHLEAHVNIKDMLLSKSCIVRDDIEHILKTQFNINHITLQFECNKCEGEKLVVNSKH